MMVGQVEPSRRLQCSPHACRYRSIRQPLWQVATGIDTLGVRRGLKTEYFVFTDPLIILSGALLLDRLSDLARHRLALPIGYTLVVLHIAIGQAEPFKYATKRTGPESVCQCRHPARPALRSVGGGGREHPRCCWAAFGRLGSAMVAVRPTWPVNIPPPNSSHFYAVDVSAQHNQFRLDVRTV